MKATHKRTPRAQAFMLVIAIVVPMIFVSNMNTHKAEAYCRTGMGLWDTPHITKTMHLSTSFPTSMRTGVNQALSQWNRPNSVLKYAVSYTGNWSSNAFLGSHSYNVIMGSAPGYAIGAQTSSRINGHMILSNQFTWVNASQDIGAGKADVQTVAVHEIGHFTGLAHPFFPDCTDGTAFTAAEALSVMVPIATGTRRTLGTDDIAAVQALY